MGGWLAVVMTVRARPRGGWPWGGFLQQGREQHDPVGEALPLGEVAQLLEELAPRAGPLAASPPQLAGTVLDLV